MADTDREYRKAFYRALNVHQGTEEEFERYYVPIYDQPDGCLLYTSPSPRD